MSAQQNDSSKNYLRFRDLVERRIVTNWTTLVRWMDPEENSDPFPSSIQLGPKVTVWRESSVEAWMERRETQSGKRQGAA